MSETKSRPLDGIASRIGGLAFEALRLRDEIIDAANRGDVAGDLDRLAVLARVDEALRRAVAVLDAARLAARELRQ